MPTELGVPGPRSDSRPITERILLTVEEAAQALGIGRSLMYELIARGEVQTVRLGRLRRVPVPALDAYVRSLCA